MNVNCRRGQKTENAVIFQHHFVAVISRSGKVIDIQRSNQFFCWQSILHDSKLKNLAWAITKLQIVRKPDGKCKDYLYLSVYIYIYVCQLSKEIYMSRVTIFLKASS